MKRYRLIVVSLLVALSCSREHKSMAAEWPIVMLLESREVAFNIERSEFGISIRGLGNDMGFSYVVCNGELGYYCAVDTSAISFPFVIKKNLAGSLSSVWTFDNVSFEIVPSKIKVPKMFLSCEATTWVLSKSAAYSHMYAFSNSCGVIGGCINADENRCYWSSQPHGLSLNPEDYEHYEVLNNEQQDLLLNGMLPVGTQEEYGRRFKCLSEERDCRNGQ